MADVRSMLKSQRSARQIKHPHAVYTTKGQLSCSLCRILLKSESQWEQHLRSEHHAKSLQKAKTERQSNNADGYESKKRKASDDEESSSKRVRSENVQTETSFAVREVKEHNVIDEALPGEPRPNTEGGQHQSTQPTQVESNKPDTVQDDVDEKEWAAFQRDMQALEDAIQEQPTLQAYSDSATIRAKPMTAAELAAQDREQKSTQKSQRERELEDEREEAQDQLQEEFDRMQELDERMKALREKKEALEQMRLNQTKAVESGAAEPQAEVGAGEDEADVTDSEDEFDEWAFGR